ncbi:SusC/RagA family TonB-linked outer membrane protein [Pedobacter gandavensis]|uniref:SusC/RagA family TonB-linked outer membrane protein n=1 Tax=Pedobacter gandavensis TaxID=2679963 RepID=A0ABR6F083_9SPHI|nr:SusC/RagA family TonB-linked outer membrane protein [Pedobacter gandavensis]MBB2150921.1 SusC/RagA family TonB-linked outer membrane protein [Pedobacter gandavensis]
MNKKATLIIFLLMISTGLLAQVRKITGKVIDQKTGVTLPGATVIRKSTNEIVSTDGAGKYSIDAATGDLLIYSYTGYVTVEHKVTADKNIINAYLEDSVNQLSEVMVTGALGIKRQARELGTSATLISNEVLNQGKVVNPLQGLASKVAGLRINMNDATTGKTDQLVQIRLRGSRSFNDAKNNPIYVVDGVPVPDIGRLNPNDIENITVLKGANAAALYGSEGVNGALMITTKKGTRGRGLVSFSNTTTFSDVYLLPPAQKQFGQGQNGVYSPTEYESWGPAFDGSIRDLGLKLPNGLQPTALYAAPSKDNRLDMFQTGRTLQNDLSFSGGDEKSTYYFSVQNVNIKGVIPGDKSSRTGARFNGSRTFGKLNTSYNVNYIAASRNTTPDGPWYSTYVQPANLDLNTLKNWRDPNSAANPLNYYTDATAAKNPFFLMDNNRNTSNQQTVNGKIELDYEFTPWFSAIYRIGLYSTSEESRATTNKLAAPSGNRNVNGSVNDGSNDFRRVNSDLILNFKKDFGKFTTRLLVGQNIRMDDSKMISIGSPNLLFPDLFNPGSRAGELEGAATITKYRALGTYGEFTAGYNNYLFLTLTGRNDIVSVLSKENRSYFYPGVSTSFVFTEGINALKDSKVLSFGKIFASYNRTGNVTLDPYSLNNAYSQINGFPFGGLVGFTPSLTSPNRDIKPEFVTSYEVGTQLGFFQDRLNLEAAYVYSDSDGQIFDAPISSATGYNSTIVNAGRLTNKIIELTLSGDVIRKDDFRWNIGFNFTHINNKVKTIFGGQEEFRMFRQAYAVVGQTYPLLKVSDYLRDEQGRVIVDAKGNTTTVADSAPLGTMVPPYQMGLSTMINFKGISIGAQFDARLGGWLYSEVVPRMYTAGTHPATAAYNREPFIFPNSVINTGTAAQPVYVENTSVFSKGDKAFWDGQGKVQRNTAAKSDFFKLRELNISYALPKALLAKQKVIREASFGLVGTNLFIVRHKSNTYGDPESLYNQTDGYLSFRQIPPTRMFGFNLNVTF